MNYPKKVMRLNELTEMGFSKSYLLRVYGTLGQQVAWKANPLKANSVLLFSTEELEKFRVKEAKMQTDCLPRG